MDDEMDIEAELHSKHLMEGFQNLRDVNIGVDIYLCPSNGNKLPAHKTILSAVSPYFRSLWQNGQLLGTELPLPHIEHRIMVKLLDFVYTGHLILGTNSVWDLMTAATHLQLVDALPLCHKYIEEHCINEEESLESKHNSSVDDENTQKELVPTVKEEPTENIMTWNEDDYQDDDHKDDEDYRPVKRTTRTRGRKRKAELAETTVPKKRGRPRKAESTPKPSKSNKAPKQTRKSSSKAIARQDQKKKTEDYSISAPKYSCKVCNRIFMYKSSWHLHTKEHTRILLPNSTLRKCVFHLRLRRKWIDIEKERDSKVNKCANCDKKFDTYCGWLWHYKKQHIHWFQCRTCDAKFTSKLTLWQHCVKKHKHRILTGKTVLRKFKLYQKWLTSKKTKERSRAKGRDGVLQCMCGEVFDKENELASHSETCSKINLNHQSYGGESQFSDTKNILDAAVVASRILEPEVMDPRTSAASFELLETLASMANVELEAGVHIGQHEGSAESVSNMNLLQRKKFVCAVCGSEYVTHSGLSRHKKKHIGAAEDEVYACEQCSKTYRSRQSLLRHIGEQHSNMIYKCQFCSFTNRSQRRLVRHQAMVHEGFKYKCDLCNRTFLSSSGLKNHKEAVHQPEVTFECSQCNKAFQVKHLWREHIKIHHENRVINCDFCDRTFKYRSSRIAHMKARHSHEVKDK